MGQSVHIDAGSLYEDGSGNLVEVLSVDEWSIQYAWDSTGEVCNAEIGDFMDDFKRV